MGLKLDTVEPAALIFTEVLQSLTYGISLGRAFLRSRGHRTRCGDGVEVVRRS